MWSEILKRALGVKHAILDRYRTNFPPAMRSLLSQYGDQPIQSISAVRVPLSKSSEDMARKFGKDLPDNLYHLFLYIVLDDGTKVLTEKNDTLNMKILGSQPSGEHRPFKLPQPTTINQLLKKTEEAMGQNMYRYSVHQMNCQDFVWNVLKANGVSLTDEDKKWIVQPANNYVSAFWQRVAQMATDFSSAWSMIKDGRGKQREPKELVMIKKALMRKKVKHLKGAGFKDFLGKMLAKLVDLGIGWFVNSHKARQGDYPMPPVNHSEPSADTDRSDYMDSIIKQMRGAGRFDQSIMSMNGGSLFSFIGNLLKSLFGSKTHPNAVNDYYEGDNLQVWEDY